MRKEELIKRIDALSPSKRKLLAGQLAGAASTGSQKSSRVVAYVVSERSVTSQKLRDRLKSLLPVYMLPSEFVLLDKMPRLPNGKVDHRALPKSDSLSVEEESTYAEPRSPIEQKLATIWENVLDIHPVGIHDNFFEIGGDSILSIQIVAQARKNGLHLGANQLFEHQTIAELSLFVQQEKEQLSNHEEFGGPIALTPIQHWFFEEHSAAPHHWNQMLAFTLDAAVSASLLQRAINTLTRRHAALRLSFSHENERWIATVKEHTPDRLFEHFNVREKTETKQNEFIEGSLRKIQEGFDLSGGGLFRGAFFECEPVQENKFVLIAHHLVVDAISWQIITDELSTFIKDPNALSSATSSSSIQSFSRHLEQQAELGKFDSELAFWQAQEQHKTFFPTDFPASIPVTEDSTETFVFKLDREATDALFSEALAAYRMRPDEILMTALLGLAQKSGLEAITMWLERHGRDQMAQDVDLSGTVGWFTTLFPLTFQCNVEQGSEKKLKLVKERLRTVPNGGIGYGVLRYLSKVGEGKLTQRPLLIFNYLGDYAMRASGPVRNAAMMFSGTRHPKSERFTVLEINCYRQDGELQFRWTYSSRHYLATSIERLSNNFLTALRALIEHCVTLKSHGYTPSDFPEAGLNQDDLDELLNSL